MMDRNRMGFRALMMIELTARDVTRSWSFPKAMRLPEKVSAPMKLPSMMVTETSTPTVLPSEASLANSPEATRADAPPPRPLNIATIWGMAVILIVLAMTAPIAAPTTMPPAIWP